MTHSQLTKWLTIGFFSVWAVLILLAILFYPAPVRSDEIKMLAWEVNDHVQVVITNVDCPAAYKNKYPKVAVAIDTEKRATMKGCFGKADEDNIIIHWDGTPDDIKYNSIIPANLFLAPQGKKQQETSKPKGIDI